MDRKLTLYILLGMVLGVVVGQMLNQLVPAEVIKESIAPWFKLLSDIFLNLIKMLVAPLVLSTIVVGIAHMGGTGALGRVGVRTLFWFILASIVSLCLGLAMVHLLQPGVGLNLPLPPENAESGIAAASVNLKDFITHLVPKSSTSVWKSHRLATDASRIWNDFQVPLA